ncbi:MAG: RluA family pseudouridine synthase [Oscillospiraceae bacterium]|jgi:23S rRNA pseudouridine955/2504/2580 synthase|nr:RluA family pseudouridine synthase [Oscillospiraceae bacterium]
MKTVLIGSNDVGKRLDGFIFKILPNVPKSLIFKFIRKNKIKINGNKSKIDYRLNFSDVLTLFLGKNFKYDLNCNKNQFMAASSQLDIVYEDKNIILVNKKAGLICHQDKNNNFNCLINKIKKYLYENGEYDHEKENSFSPALVNRIDRNTSGIVIAAKNAISLKILNEKIKNREIKKYYQCLVYGKMEKQEDILTAFLIKDETQNKVFISKCKTENSKIIKTKYKVKKSEDNISLLNIELLTGRCHQIRAHLAWAGHPIIGDGKYGLKKSNDKLPIIESFFNSDTNRYQALLAYKIKFEFDSDAGILNYLNGKEIELI